ncbi:hypothetical protein WP50_32245, partial [Lactiplantibacillus plantarum]
TARIRELLNEPEEQLTVGVEHAVANETLAMHHVDFAYDDDQQILHDVSFEAKPNTVVAFAGPSGGGKSTIFGLLERYYQPTVNCSSGSFNNSRIRAVEPLAFANVVKN